MAGRLVRRLVVTTERDDRGPTGLRTTYTLVGTCLCERAALDEHVFDEMIASFTLLDGGPALGER